MRLVDADALKAKAFGKRGGLIHTSDIDAAPTVDAVPVVRCKDCKNSEHWYADRRRCFLWSEDGVSVFDDGFCSYAERRTDG